MPSSEQLEHTAALAARILCQKLGEKNFKLMKKLATPMPGPELASIFDKVVKVQKEGGLTNEQLGGFKTPGGVFITMCKQLAPQTVDLRKLKKQVTQETKVETSLLSLNLELK